MSPSSWSEEDISPDLWAHLKKVALVRNNRTLLFYGHDLAFLLLKCKIKRCL